MGYTANADIASFYRSAPLERACRRIARGMLRELHREVRVRTPVSKPPPGVGQTQYIASRGGRRPATLRDSWETTDVDRTRSPQGEARFEGEEYTLDPIAPHVEWPTRPHVIRPSPDRMPASVIATRRPRRAGTDPAARLRFVNQHGRVVYAAEVHHPGTQGVYMMRNALTEVDATWVDRVGTDEMVRWAHEQMELVR